MYCVCVVLFLDRARKEKFEKEQEDGEEGILENAEDRTNEQAYVLDEDSGVITLEELSYPEESAKGL